jgi:NAD(P)-dependent dehydrogenase (short-subunit alcohol dehydrogenase family)
MHVKDKVIVVTGGANGIGEALCRRFVKEGARAVVAADLDEERVKTVASELGIMGIKVDVAKEADIVNLVETTEKQIGPIDLFCSNAGIISSDAPGWTAASADNTIWQKSWEIHVMAHVYAARAVLPYMIARGEGYLLNTSSAAGLLNQIGSAPYSTTKHAAIGFAEALAITHGDDGIKVSVLCPQAVRTQMVAGSEGGSAAVDGIMEPEDVAECVVQGLAEETFLILPHPEVKTYYQRKASDYNRWINGMRRFAQKIIPYMKDAQRENSKS